MQQRSLTTSEEDFLDQLKEAYTKAIGRGDIDTPTAAFITANFVGALVGLVPEEKYPDRAITELVRKNIDEGNERILKMFNPNTATILRTPASDDGLKIWH